MRLVNHVVRRLASAVITLLGLSLLIFYSTTFFSPEQRLTLFISPFSSIGGWAPDQTLKLIKLHHLDDAFHIQYVTWLKEVLSGSLGYSYLYNKPVTEVISNFLPATLEIVLYATPIIILGGYKLGVFSAKRAHEKAPREDPIDFSMRTITTIVYSIPSFVLGILLLVIFFLSLSWFPPERHSLNVTPPAISYTGLLTIDGLLNGRFDVTLDALRHLVLPVLVVSMQNLAVLLRITRSSMGSELLKPYVTAAKAKGLDESEVINHAKKNSLTSVLTVSGILFANLFTGVVVTEYVFNIKGLGYAVVRAANRMDFAVLVGISLFVCLVFMVVNLIVDIAYTYIDPRVKL